VRVLGIDPGIATSGYGCLDIDGQGSRLHECGAITTPAGVPLPRRLSEIHRQIEEVIGRSRPDAAAVEKLFFGANTRTAMNVGQARGVMLLALQEAGISIHEYTPLEVKQAVTGYGRATKRQVQEMIRVLLQLEDIPRPDDAADAVAVAICHLQSSGWLEAVRQAGA
jgi:crossover junction endodeoxyribonuclease RuvC